MNWAYANFAILRRGSRSKLARGAAIRAHTPAVPTALPLPCGA
jgi:hypothetical protein